MDNVRKKVLLDLVASPMTVLPVTAGGSCLLAAWALGTGGLLAFAGAGGILIGLGSLISRFILGIDKLSSDIFKYENEEQFKQKEQKLNELDARLCKDGDRRTEKLLRELRKLNNSFQEDINEGMVTANINTILEKVQQLFKGCISQLEHSLSLSGDSHRKVIDEVSASVEQLKKIIKEFHSFRAEKMTSNLQQLRDDLEKSMEVARITEEHISSIDKNKTYNEEEFLK